MSIHHQNSHPTPPTQTSTQKAPSTPPEYKTLDPHALCASTTRNPFNRASSRRANSTAQKRIAACSALFHLRTTAIPSTDRQSYLPVELTHRRARVGGVKKMKLRRNPTSVPYTEVVGLYVPPTDGEPHLVEWQRRLFAGQIYLGPPERNNEYFYHEPGTGNMCYESSVTF